MGRIRSVPPAAVDVVAGKVTSCWDSPCQPSLLAECRFSGSEGRGRSLKTSVLRDSGASAWGILVLTQSRRATVTPAVATSADDYKWGRRSEEAS